MKDLFCAKCQAVTPHKGSVDANGEFLFECQNMLPADTPDGEPVKCDRFIKFAAPTTPSAFQELAGKHEEGNVGQVSLEGQEKTLSLILGQVTDEVTEAEKTKEETQA